MKRKKQVEKSQGDLAIKFIFVGFFLIATIIFLNSRFNKESVEDKQANPNSYTAEMKDGIQYAQLGWGKINYYPDEIVVTAGLPVRLSLDLKRVKGCYRSFQIPNLNIRKRFSEGDNLLEFTPQKPGTYRFSCSMGMGTGRLKVV